MPTACAIFDTNPTECQFSYVGKKHKNKRQGKVCNSFSICQCKEDIGKRTHVHYGYRPSIMGGKLQRIVKKHRGKNHFTNEYSLLHHDTNRSASLLPHRALKGFVILGPTGPTNSGRFLWF